MSFVFYDKETLEVENKVKDLNERIDHLQKLGSKDREYLRAGGAIYDLYNERENEEIAWTLSNESTNTRLKATIGTAVAFITIWELVKGAHSLFKWLRRELRVEDEDKATEKRLHARDWKRYR